MKRVLLFAALAVLRLQAQDPDAPPPPTAATSATASNAAAVAGKTQFQQLCGFCHGRDARGASGPDLLRSSLVSHDVNGNLIGDVVRNGRPDKGMPPFQLSAEQIGNIAAYLHAEASRAASVASTIPSDYPLDKLLIGDAAAGQMYFGQHCAACHSVTGDLSHIASKYKPFDLQTHVAFPSGAKSTVTVTMSSGESLSGEQVYSDEFYVSLRDKSGAVRTWKRGTVALVETDPLAQHVRLLKSYTDKDLHDVFAYLETLK